MKLQDFDFRVWDYDNNQYINKKYNELCNFKENYEIELFTGLYDKNGKKIYENDIIFFRNKSIERDFIHIVKFKNGRFFIEDFSKYYNSDRAISDILVNCFEIIGNIHENTELLKLNNAK